MCLGKVWQTLFIKWEFIFHFKIHLNSLESKNSGFCVEFCVGWSWELKKRWTAVAERLTSEAWSSVSQYRAYSGLARSQWEMSLQSNTVSHWLGANLESVMQFQTSELLWIVIIQEFCWARFPNIIILLKFQMLGLSSVRNWTQYILFDFPPLLINSLAPGKIWMKI